MPWVPLQSMATMLARQPTLPVGEAAFIGLALAALAHAACHGRQHMLLWLGALVGGAANDVFFMMLPFVDNFWHAQATLMLTPRLPVYILAVYIAFIYVPTAASWRLNCAPVARWVAAAVTAGLLYAPFDLTGAKFLWWTWHDTDAAVQARWLGVPIGSTMFTIMHTFCFSALLHAFALRSKTLGIARFAIALLGLCILGTPAMMLAMSPCNILQLRIEDGVATQLPGRPDATALALELFFLAAIAKIGSRGASSAPPHFLARISHMDKKLWLAAAGYFVALAFVMAFGDPAAVVAEGVHQQYGPCSVPDYDLSNYKRAKYLCKAKYDEDFHFGCAPWQKLPGAIPTWYTLCGKPHTDHALYLGTVVALGVAASLALGKMLLAATPAPRRKLATSYSKKSL